MSIFNTIRELLGTNETTNIVIHDEDDNILTEDQLVDRRVEALTETIAKGEQSLIDLTKDYDEADQEFDLKLQACEAVLAKGEDADVTLNKQVLNEKRSKCLDKFVKDATKLKAKLDVQKAELDELEELGKGGQGSGIYDHHKNKYKELTDDEAYDLMSVVDDKLSPEKIKFYHKNPDKIDSDKKLTDKEKSYLKEEFKKSEDSDLIDWFYNDDTEEFMSKATELVAQASPEQQSGVGEFMKAWELGGKVVDQRQAIEAALTVTGLVQKKTEDLTKAEGSRGGHIIGHTKSGKAVYASKEPDDKSYHDFSHQDHKDASNLHYFEENKYIREHHRDPISGNVDVPSLIGHHRNVGRTHGNLARKLEAEGGLSKAEDYSGHYANVILKDKEGKILFLKRAADKAIEPNKYCLPGGHIDDGESIVEAAARELQEEANLTVRPEDLFISTKIECQDGKWAFYLSAPTYNEEQGLLATLDGESNNACWASQAEWLDMDLLYDLKDHLLKIIGQSGDNVQVTKGEEEEIELTDEELDELTKGGKPKVGERKSFGGKDYHRTEKGWKARKSKGHTGHTAEQLTQHAQSTSDTQLRKVSKNKEVHISLRDAARHELGTRTKASKVDKVSDILTQIENKAKKEKLGVKDLIGQLREHLEGEQKERDKSKKVVDKN